LRWGDTVALIRPASKLSSDSYRIARDSLRKLGFCVAEYPGTFRSDSFFAASDENRAEELHWAMSEPGIRGVFACRGGYGSQRTLSLVTPSMRARWRPKIILGYSDLTYLHQWVQNQLGWISFHGPLLGMMKPKNIQKLMETIVELPRHSEVQEWGEIRNFARSKNSGPAKLVGGNLSLLQVSGPAALPNEPLILALEDVNENFYRIDRMLRNLKDAGYSKYIRGIIVGTLTGCGKDDAHTFKLVRLRESLCELTKGPVWMGARFGHGLHDSARLQRILPLGCKVELKENQIRFLEPFVC
jgi:muramoyltetrapeptide carboxypeptidase